MRVAFGYEAKGKRALDGRGHFVAFGAGTSEALASIVAVARRGIGELQMRAAQRPAKLVAEGRVAARQFADEGVAADEHVASDMK